MSNIVLNEKLINRSKIKHASITVRRFNYVNMGVRIWFQIQTTELRMFQRWSMLMNPTDEVLLLTKEGDVLEIDYIEDIAEDEHAHTFEPFSRNMILSANFVYIG